MNYGSFEEKIENNALQEMPIVQIIVLLLILVQIEKKEG